MPSNFRRELYPDYKANRRKPRKPRWVALWQRYDTPLHWWAAEPECCPWLDL